MSNPWDDLRKNGFKLTISLSESEAGNMNGWVNKGFAEPDFANFPWRIVLEERTRARFDEIAAQFVAGGFTSYPPGWGNITPPPPPPPSPGVASEIIIGAPANFSPPPGTFENTVLENVFTAEQSQTLEVNMPAKTSFSLPLRLPAGPWNNSKRLTITAAEFQSGTTLRQACFSEIPNDWSQAVNNKSFSAGTSVSPSVDDCEALGWGPGKIIYLNIRCWMPDYDNPTNGFVTNPDFNAKVRLGAPAKGWPH